MPRSAESPVGTRWPWHDMSNRACPWAMGGNTCRCVKQNAKTPQLVNKPNETPAFTLDRGEVITAIYGLRNYIHILKEAIKKPDTEHRPAEAAVALIDAEPLLEKLEKWAKVWGR